MNLDEKKHPGADVRADGNVTCPLFKQGRWGHGGSGNQDYCLGYGPRQLRIPSIDERSRFCFSGQFDQCPTHRFVQEESRKMETPGA